jgi:hypothetical protein
MARCLAVFFGVLTLSSCAVSPVTRSVILTTDVGCEVDDQWAMVSLLRSPTLETLGIVTTHAPNLEAPAAETSASVARQVLERLELKNAPPVFAGSSQALELRNQPRRNAGVDFMVETGRRFSSENRLVIIHSEQRPTSPRRFSSTPDWQSVSRSSPWVS